MVSYKAERKELNTAIAKLKLNEFVVVTKPSCQSRVRALLIKGAKVLSFAVLEPYAYDTLKSKGTSKARFLSIVRRISRPYCDNGEVSFKSELEYSKQGNITAVFARIIRVKEAVIKEE